MYKILQKTKSVTGAFSMTAHAATSYLCRVHIIYVDFSY